MVMAMATVTDMATAMEARVRFAFFVPIDEVGNFIVDNFNL